MVKTVVILGMHRSGTSLIAGILYYLGVDMGKQLVGRTWTNPLGHFENIDFLNLNEKILKEAGRNWRVPPSRDEILKLKDKFAKEIKEIVRKNKNTVWGWKDPRTVLTIDLYIPFLENPYFIVCQRNIMNIAKSLYKRNKISIEEGLNLTNIYISRIDEFFRDNKGYSKRRLDLSYEEIINDPLRNIRRIIEFLGLNPSKDQIMNALTFVKPRDKIEELEKKMRIEKEKKMKNKLVSMIKKPWYYPIYIYKIIKNPELIKKYIDILIHSH